MQIDGKSQRGTQFFGQVPMDRAKEAASAGEGAGGMRLPTQREALESPGGLQRLFSHAKRYPTAARCLLGSVDKKDTRRKGGRKTAEENQNH